MDFKTLISDPIIWYSLAVIIFIGVFTVSAKKPIASWLDSEIAKVRDELDLARKLRMEAEASLADYRSKQQSAMTEAAEILTHAKAEAARLREEASVALKHSLAQQEQQAAARIKQAEAEAISEVRQAIIADALAQVRANLADKLSAELAGKLVDQAIAELPALAKISKKAEAA